MTGLEICEKLKSAGIENAEWETELLLEHFCKEPAGRRSLWMECNYESNELLTAVNKRILHEPLQYLLGEWDFYRQSYLVSPECLIPRSDTEILVEEAIRLLPFHAKLVDLCTGSGCIAISTLAERPDLYGTAVDISVPALELAKKNAKRNGVENRLEFLQADLLHEEEKIAKILSEADAVLSNPPYIRSDVIKDLSEEVKKEPMLALDGGKDGLIFYRKLISLAEKHLKKSAVCLFEIGFDQAKEVAEIATGAGFFCKIRKDYGENDRVAILTR